MTYKRQAPAIRMEDELTSLRAKLAGLAGSALDDVDVARIVGEAIKGGNGVYIELDEHTRYRLVKRDGQLQLVKEATRRPSTLPPRR
jgi:hypothetical protein